MRGALARGAAMAAAWGMLLAPLPGVAQSAGRPISAPQALGHGTVVTDTVWSQALGTNKTLMVYLPPSYRTSPGRRYPVAYYLHGANGDETSWTRLGQIDVVMDSLVAAGMPEMILAMPDGDQYSFYTTYNVLLTAAGCRQLMLPPGASAEHDCVAWPHYDDYIAYDIVRHVDAKYRTLASRIHRGIAGLSMGGYGAVELSLQYPALFGAAASHSGVLSPLDLAATPFARMLRRPTADSARFARARASFAPVLRVVFGADSVGWYARDPATTAARLVRAGVPLPVLFVDAGTDDGYTPESRAFRDAMAALDVPVTYHEWPGAHTWTYWRAHVGESLKWLAGHIATPPPR